MNSANLVVPTPPTAAVRDAFQMLNGPFRGSEALAAGLVSYRRLHGAGYRRLFPDVYVHATAPLDLLTRSRAAYLLVRDRGGALAGYSAAALLGADCAPRDAPAEVMVPRYLRAFPNLRVSYGRPETADVELVSGCLVTTPERTAWDLARRSPLVEAVVAVDAVAHKRFEPADLLTRRAKHPGARGCRRLDEVVRLSNPRAESPMETRLRLALLAAGLPVPEVQYDILDRDWWLVARVDLAYPDAKLAIEYDGAPHFDARQRAQDLHRDNELARYGWHTMRIDRRQATTGLERTISNVRSVLKRRVHRWRRLPASEGL
ncbi:hypothetical protein GCM10023321_34940 [Pseudonocardia eucalypti]|uniref:DUF559 domain-containing protein n=1 Tax=Pseudonocardia eucalypti TaxID=648755 RepID=A0ABP9Q8B8_9PSEU|nr:very-short-patch-repair endonuclease [Pseudonocardia eucalypti]